MNSSPTVTGQIHRVFIAHPSPDLYGSDRVLLETVTALRDDGLEVVVALPHDGPLAPALVARGATVTVVPMLVLRKALLRPSGLLTVLTTTPVALRAGWKALRAARSEALYVNTVTIPLWFVLGRLRRIPVLAHVHEAEDEVATPIRFALTAPLALAHRIVVNSKATAAVLTDTIRHLGRRITLVYNGVPGPDETVAPRSELSGGVRLVLVGRLSPRKGSDVAVDALALLRRQGIDASLDFVGSIFPGYEWYSEQLQKAVADHGLQESVTFSGFRDSVWDSLSAADIALVPSRLEPFGNAAVEAQLADRPVVVSDAQGLVETVSDGAFGRVVPAGDAQALADAVAGLVADWPASLELSRQANEHARTEFGIERYHRQIAAVVTGLGRQPRESGRP